MVFEETASHKPQSWPTWNHWSALVPKVPAPLWFSYQNAQTHRLPDRPVQFIEDKMHSVYFVIDKLHRARPRLSYV